MGHADLHVANCYVKLLRQPGKDETATRLNTYLARAQQRCR
jgi:hypothetical protein